MNSSAVLNERALADQIVDELEPLIARQRKAIYKAGCLLAMSSTQLHVLFLLASEGPQPMSHLAEALGVSLPNVTGIVDRMVEHGHVERTRDDEDRRLVVVGMTDAGRRALDEIDLVRRATLARVIAALGSTDQQLVLDAFRRLRAAADQLKD
jgi:DNA-binding MarR family transcriptional regulator